MLRSNQMVVLTSSGCESRSDVRRPADQMSVSGVFHIETD